MWHEPSPEAKAFAVALHREVAQKRPNASSIPVGPWPVAQVKVKPLTAEGKPVTAQEIVNLLRKYPEGLTSVEIRDLLPCPPGYVSGLLKWRIQSGEIVTTLKGRAAVYRVAKRKRSPRSQDTWRKQREKEVAERRA